MSTAEVDDMICSGSVSMGSMGSTESIKFEKRVQRTHQFLRLDRCKLNKLQLKMIKEEPIVATTNSYGMLMIRKLLNKDLIS